MTETTYWIYSGDQPCTNANGLTLDDLEVTKRVAQEISEDQPDATIVVCSYKPERNLSDWTGVAAVFISGEEITPDHEDWPHEWHPASR
jgi:hypothetical protein